MYTSTLSNTLQYKRDKSQQLYKCFSLLTIRALKLRPDKDNTDMQQRKSFF